MKSQEGVLVPKGFLAGTAKAGIKYKDRLDLGIIYSEKICTAAAVYTKNSFVAAPLIVTKKHLENGKAQAIVINTGSANACTGEEGIADAYKMCEITAKELGIKEKDVLVASTGVIGMFLPMKKIEKGIINAVKTMDRNQSDLISRAIMTTDTKPKYHASEIDIKKKKVFIGGIAKGAGMIHPDMATMLAFITTDAVIDSDTLSIALKGAVDETFNMVSVDGDMSTNDMVCILANGMSDSSRILPDSIEYNIFYNALCEVCRFLTMAIAKDGEGATKLVSIVVKGAACKSSAKTAARSLATSCLVKTAIYGEDANWGRILARIGSLDIAIRQEEVSVYISGICVFDKGKPIPFDEKLARERLSRDEVDIIVDLGSGDYKASAFTCDLTENYIKINAHYRT